jgi:hypothetical protein
MFTLKSFVGACQRSSPGKNHLWTCCLLIVVLPLLCASPCLGQSTVESGQSSENGCKATFAIDSGPGLIFLPVMIGETERFFVLDSGSAIHLVDESYGFESMSELANALTPTSSISIRVCRSPEISVGTINIPKESLVGLHNFADISTACGRPVHGILGNPFFRHYALLFDFQSKSLGVYSSGEVSRRFWTYKVPLRAQAGLFFIDNIRVNGKRTPFLVDTGKAGALSLSHDTFNSAIKSDALTVVGESNTTYASGESTRRTGWLEEFRFGELEEETIYVSESRVNTIGLGYCCWRFGIVQS